MPCAYYISNYDRACHALLSAEHYATAQAILRTLFPAEILELSKLVPKVLYRWLPQHPTPDSDWFDLPVPLIRFLCLPFFPFFFCCCVGCFVQS